MYWIAARRGDWSLGRSVSRDQRGEECTSGKCLIPSVLDVALDMLPRKGVERFHSGDTFHSGLLFLPRARRQVPKYSPEVCVVLHSCTPARWHARPCWRGGDGLWVAWSHLSRQRSISVRSHNSSKRSRRDQDLFSIDCSSVLFSRSGHGSPLRHLEF